MGLKPIRANGATAKDKDTIIKTVAIPLALYQEVEGKAALDPEFNFSKYVRELIRKNLAKMPRALKKAA